MMQLQKQNGDKVTAVQAAQAAARRAQLTAVQESRHAAQLAVALRAKAGQDPG